MTDPGESIHPIVLVGGRSSRFGRDKLREPMAGGGWLVDRPIGVLRSVFGDVVATVGGCHPDVSSRAPRRITDRYPGRGPIGGVLSALQETGASVFVLAGDMPWVSVESVRLLLRAAIVKCSAAAVLAATPHGLEPCVGVYRPRAAAILAERVLAAASPGSGSETKNAMFALGAAFRPCDLETVDIPARDMVSVNRIADLSKINSDGDVRSP